MVKKVLVDLPEPLMQKLQACIPTDEQNRFIVEAIEERLLLIEQMLVLDETAGAWSDARHPDMRTDEDIDRWIDDLRAPWTHSG